MSTPDFEITPGYSVDKVWQLRSRSSGEVVPRTGVTVTLLGPLGPVELVGTGDAALGKFTFSRTPAQTANYKNGLFPYTLKATWAATGNSYPVHRGFIRIVPVLLSVQ